MADDTAELQALINNTPSGQTANLSKAVYIITGTITGKAGVTLDMNGATIIAEFNTKFEYMILASGLTDFHVVNGVFDANASNRTTGQTNRLMTLGFINCTDCSAARLRVQNTLGFLPSGTTIPVSAVGLVIGGTSLRCSFDECTAVNCGTVDLPSDGFFVSGDQCLVSGCKATSCTDTGFIIETSNYSGVTGCTANLCGGGAAIVNGSGLNKRGNFLKALTINDWKSAVTGGVQIGCPINSTGNLYDTDVDVIITAPTSGRGVGPAINVNQAGGGRAIGVTIQGRINGATEQGVLVDGDDVLITGMTISGTSGAAVQFQPGRIDGRVEGGRINGGLNGVVGLGNTRFSVAGVRFKDQVGWGVYAYDTATAEVDNCTFLNPGAGRVGKDAAAPAYVFSGRVGPSLATNNAAGSATTGTIVNKLPLSDVAGNVLGFLPIYNG